MSSDLVMLSLPLATKLILSFVSVPQLHSPAHNKGVLPAVKRPPSSSTYRDSSALHGWQQQQENVSSHCLLNWIADLGWIHFACGKSKTTRRNKATVQTIKDRHLYSSQVITVEEIVTLWSPLKYCLWKCSCKPFLISAKCKSREQFSLH